MAADRRAGPCVMIESPAGLIELWVQSPNRYRVKGPSGEQVVEGLQQVREVVHGGSVLSTVRRRLGSQYLQPPPDFTGFSRTQPALRSG